MKLKELAKAVAFGVGFSLACGLSVMGVATVVLILVKVIVWAWQ